jgi:hypothetical protein
VVWQISTHGTGTDRGMETLKLERLKLETLELKRLELKRLELERQRPSWPRLPKELIQVYS